ncbi:hypothetical protein [Thermofilum sp.]|uniref:hypothetical protein n=1 Tax=Thermofilum sp. TaxID=1961369 RepID=UPI002586E5BD|nr:hypothetical protein [Thermofilum sp.]
MVVQPRPPRPLGVTVVAILQFLSGALFILAGAALTALPQLAELPVPGLASFLRGPGAFLLVIGALFLIIGWGLWPGEYLAWWQTVVLEAAWLVSSLASLVSGDVTAVVSLITAAIILYYFFKPHIKAYFRVK